jgi:hypothetical protein
MPHRRILNMLLMVTLFSLYASADLLAAEQYGWVYGRYRGPVPYYIGNPKNIEVAQPVPVYVNAKTMQPSAPLPNQANMHAYPYGYFGTQYRPYTVSSRNYYNDFSQTSFRRGY